MVLPSDLLRTLVRLCWKLLPDLEEDKLQDFPNEEISKSKIPVMVCAMRSFEGIDDDNIAVRRRINSSQKQVTITNYSSK
jgi:hypothetical protein